MHLDLDHRFVATGGEFPLALELFGFLNAGKEGLAALAEGRPRLGTLVLVRRSVVLLFATHYAIVYSLSRLAGLLSSVGSLLVVAIGLVAGLCSGCR